ncbi:hypothetical protein CHGG_10752 [Chaetomium globosum CBS 148.51]|uniref:Carrier domain-containing protein n=1 Tax=Chaetomium globosum (strain ATCC 6205 / CBS 148.51 / DSM 1962 / NBRC 6347 / NRRL 1970) TaxID=306901 RepID=Q2GMQ2_CHAGB|nr:uncharacterized protein CHGG_10752 [Chaetomium globosum CBS 148.51]EAQ82934.1 hypothetical protein CHGG_10752 [Chaetomium globosum CBS 148.51]
MRNPLARESKHAFLATPPSSPPSTMTMIDQTVDDGWLDISKQPHGAAKTLKQAKSLHITFKQVTRALSSLRGIGTDTDSGGQWASDNNEIESEIECTPAQQEQLRRDPDAAKRPAVIRLDLSTDMVKSFDQLHEAWLALSLQHHILRTTIVKEKNNDDFVLRIFKRPRNVRGGFDANFEHIHTFGFQGPAMLVVEWASFTPHVTLCLPQLVADSTSLGHLWRDFLSLLSGWIPPLRLTFPQYLSLATRNTSRESARDFWDKTLGSLPDVVVHSFPLERHQTFQTTRATSPVSISGSSLKRCAKQLGVSEYAVVYAALGLVLDRHCNLGSEVHDIAFVAEGRNKTVKGHESVIGYVDQEYPLRLQMNPERTAAAVIKEAERLNTLSTTHAFFAGSELLDAVSAIDFKLSVAVGDDEGLLAASEPSNHSVGITVQISHAVSIVAQHDTAIPVEKVKVVLDHFTMALSEMVKHPNFFLSEIEIISPPELDLILEMGMPLTVPSHDNVHKLFERQVLLTPDAPALQFEGNRPLTYDELNRISNRVARHLPVGRGSFVPVCLERSANLIISLVAILKTGAAYVTIDPDTPQERNNFIVEDVGAQVVIVDKTTTGRFPGREVVIEELIAESIRAQDTNLDRACDPSDPVYVIYTSGSTGKPKGVLHVHSSATSGLAAFPTLPDLRQLLFHNPVFSAAQRSVWSTLKQGGCLCLASKENLTVHIGRTINQMQINVIDVTPSTALLLTPGTVPCLKRMTVAGELINPALIPTWVNELELLNAYGLSENTQVNWRREMVLGQNPQNIGRPSDTTTSFVLVPGTTRLSPLLVPGELCLGGDQLALHYLNRPEKTAEAFIDNPFGPGRLYRTGDMVVAHEDGSIEMVGRIDFQVKINGQRVEPGDSNTILQTHPDVSNSSVVAAEIGGRKSLVAAIVAKTGSALEWPRLRSELKDLLAQHIPSYMMPTYWLLQTELPLNVNGKVDIPRLTKDVQGLGRDTLLRFSTDNHSAPESLNGVSQGEGTAHLTEPAQKLCEILASVLKLTSPRISTSENTFQELGGSSLDAIRVSTKAYQDDIQVSVPDILRLPLHALLGKAKALREKAHEDVPHFSLLPKNANARKMDYVEDAYPTTSLQDSFLADSLRGGSTYIYRRYYRLKGVSHQEVRKALESLIPRIPLLRTTFILNKTSFLQLIRKTVPVLSWDDLPQVTAREYSALEKRTMELGGNFVHFASLRDGILAVTMHHALFDYWSNNFLIDDLSNVLGNKPLPRRPAYVDFVNHTLKLQTAEQAQLKKFWRDKLNGVLPTVLGQTTEDSAVVEAILAQDVQHIAASHNVSIGSLIYAVWGVVLSMHTGRNDILFGATLSGRDVPVQGITDMAGPTIATVPFRIQLDTETSLLDLARTIQDEIWAVAPKAQFGLRNIVKEANLTAKHYDTLVNVLIKDTEAVGSDRDSSPLVPCEPHEPNFVPDHTMLEAETMGGNGLRLRLLSGLTHAKASLLLGNVAETVKIFLERPDTRISDIVPTSVEELKFLDSQSNVRPTEPGLTAVTLVDRIITQYPEKTALQELSDATRKRGLSYRQFGDAVDRLARYLLTKGAKKGDIIPICMRKSINTLIAVFGVLKAGAAYTPLDPKNPRDRNDFITHDVGATITITDSTHSDVFESFTGEVINLDTVDTTGDINTFAGELLEPSVRDLAYVIYTSGSTGLPKGVQVHHGAVGASTEGMIEACNIDDKWHVLWFLNYVFDASYFDVFTVLSSGGTISIADQDTLMQDLAGCVNAFGAEQLMITPTISKLISPEQVPTLKALLVCGEPITPEVASVWATRMDVYNGYGPTEATILMTVSKVLPEGNLKSVGYPLKAVKATILHPELLVPVPYGTVGELCVGGDQVAIGYLNRPELTTKAFTTAADGSPIYRTGDYARWLPSGEIECLGRRDNQVKLNGFRIELGEIENTILTQAADMVETCVVTVAEVQRKKQIVVYYVPVEKPEGEVASSNMYATAVVDPVTILDRLQSLAHYMMPKIFLPFKGFPLLASGKINRKQLAGLAEGLDPKTLAGYSSTAPISNGPAVSDSELTEEERTLRGAWAELFEVEPETIDPGSLFYHYGGDSIAAINLGSMLRSLNFSLSVNDVVTYPSLKEQAQRIKPVKAPMTSALAVKLEVSQTVKDKLQASGLSDDDIEDIYPCGPGQVEFLTQGHTEDQFWMLMTVRRLPSGFDLDRWIELTRGLTQANQILRAMYMKQDDADPLSWVQIILKEPVMDLAMVDCESANSEEKNKLILKHWDQRFAIGRPFVRYLVLRYPDGTMDLATKLDHAMYDGTLLRIFDDQFTALRDGQPMPVSPTPFRTFVEYTNQPELRDPMLNFWKTALANNTFTFPSHIAHPKVSAVALARTAIPVNAYARTAGVTASIVFQAAYSLLLAKLSNAPTADVTYDYLLTGRNVDLDDPQLINGTCANFLPFRSRIGGGGDGSVQTLLKDTQSGFWAMTENGSVALGDIYGKQGLGVDRATHAAKTLFLFQPFEPAPAEQDNMRWIVMAMSKVTMYVNYAVMFEVFKDVDGGHKLKMGYDSRLFDAEQAKGVLQTYLGIVQDIVDGKKTEVGQFLG